MLTMILISIATYRHVARACPLSHTPDGATIGERTEPEVYQAPAESQKEIDDDLCRSFPSLPECATARATSEESGDAEATNKKQGNAISWAKGSGDATSTTHGFGDAFSLAENGGDATATTTGGGNANAVVGRRRASIICQQFPSLPECATALATSDMGGDAEATNNKHGNAIAWAKGSGDATSTTHGLGDAFSLAENGGDATATTTGGGNANAVVGRRRASIIAFGCFGSEDYIPSRLVCDGNFDCSNGYDESEAVCGGNFLETMMNGEDAISVVENDSTTKSFPKHNIANAQGGGDALAMSFKGENNWATSTHGSAKAVSNGVGDAVAIAGRRRRSNLWCDIMPTHPNCITTSGQSLATATAQALNGGSANAIANDNSGARASATTVNGGRATAQANVGDLSSHATAGSNFPVAMTTPSWFNEKIHDDDHNSISMADATAQQEETENSIWKATSSSSRHSSSTKWSSSGRRLEDNSPRLDDEDAALSIPKVLLTVGALGFVLIMGLVIVFRKKINAYEANPVLLAHNHRYQDPEIVTVQPNDVTRVTVA